MGIYLNPGKENFQTALDSEIYVDKTEMLMHLNAVVNTLQKYVCVSRPRRFGKTMAADMLCAYYDREADSRGLFERRMVAECPPQALRTRVLAWDTYLGAFDALRLTMTDFVGDADSVPDVLSYLTDEVTNELMEAYPDVSFGSRINLRTVMSGVYARTKRQFVVVIDEWDAVFRVWEGDARGQKKYLDFLRDWLKDKPYIALAYMTGILPIKKYGRHSALNMFTEYSVTSPKNLARYVGFTADEVRDICELRGLDYEAMKDWYDGYRITYEPSSELVASQGLAADIGEFEVYSPLSVVSAALFRQFENYWNKTETYEALADYIRRDYDGLKEAVALLMDGGRVRVDTSTYQNDMTTFHGRDDVLALLVHLGYLGFDDRTSEVFIPNREILDEFKTSTKSAEWAGTFRAFEASKELLEATWALDEGRVAGLLEEAHDRAANRTYNDEAALSYAVQYAYYAAQRYYTTILELDSGKGYADVAYLPAPGCLDKPALLVELKYGRTAEGAVAQIRQRRYPERLEHYRGNLLLVGINYDRNVPAGRPGFKRHTCVIERA